jgi:hypothetical protein
VSLLVVGTKSIDTGTGPSHSFPPCPTSNNDNGPHCLTFIHTRKQGKPHQELLRKRMEKRGAVPPSHFPSNSTSNGGNASSFGGQGGGGGGQQRWQGGKWGGERGVPRWKQQGQGHGQGR